MKTVRLAVVALSLVFAQQVNAQDTNQSSHVLDVSVPEIALLDIYDAGALAKEIEANDIIQFDLANGAGVSEAGIYTFAGISRTGLWLNYTSVVGVAASGFDTERTIDVKMVANGVGEAFPKSLDLIIDPGNAVIEANGGDHGVAVADARLGKTTAVGANARLVNGIGSVHTGDGAKGFPLTYSLVQNGDFAEYKAGSYSAVIEYTLSDL